jgi:hypothetical protein
MRKNRKKEVKTVEIIKFSDFLDKKHQKHNEEKVKSNLLKVIFIILAIIIFGSDFIEMVDRIGGMPIGGNGVFTK